MLLSSEVFWSFGVFWLLVLLDVWASIPHPYGRRSPYLNIRVRVRPVRIDYYATSKACMNIAEIIMKRNAS